MSIDKKIYDQAIKRGLIPTVANLLVAQARFESADYTSNVYKQNKNLFGYKFVGQRGATRGTVAPKSEWPNANTPGYYAKYATIEDSVNEVINWLFRRQQEGKFLVNSLTTAGKYAAGLKAGNYYGDSAANYSNGLTAKLKKIDFLTGPSGASTMAGALPIFLLIGLALAAFKK
jgi:uncharacterized FlgJ-related protein